MESEIVREREERERERKREREEANRVHLRPHICLHPRQIVNASAVSERVCERERDGE